MVTVRVLIPPSLCLSPVWAERARTRPQLLVENPLCVYSQKQHRSFGVFLHLGAARKLWEIVSYFVLHSADQALVTVGKWALLAACEKEINRERQALGSVSFMCCYHFRSGFERDMSDFMCLPLFFHMRFGGARLVCVLYIFKCTFKGSSSDSTPLEVGVGVFPRCADITSVALSIHKGISADWITPKLTRFTEVDGGKKSSWLRSAGYSLQHSNNDTLALKWNMKLEQASAYCFAVRRLCWVFCSSGVVSSIVDQHLKC